MILVPMNGNPTNLYVVRGNLNHQDESTNTSITGSFNTEQSRQLSPPIQPHGGKRILGHSPSR